MSIETDELTIKVLVHLPANDMSGLKLILNVSPFSLYIIFKKRILVHFITGDFTEKMVFLINHNFLWNRHLILVMDSGAQNFKNIGLLSWISGKLDTFRVFCIANKLQNLENSSKNWEEKWRMLLWLRFWYPNPSLLSIYCSCSL